MFFRAGRMGLAPIFAFGCISVDVLHGYDAHVPGVCVYYCMEKDINYKFYLSLLRIFLFSKRCSFILSNFSICFSFST